MHRGVETELPHLFDPGPQVGQHPAGASRGARGDRGARRHTPDPAGRRRNPAGSIEAVPWWLVVVVMVLVMAVVVVVMVVVFGHVPLPCLRQHTALPSPLPLRSGWCTTATSSSSTGPGCYGANHCDETKETAGRSSRLSSHLSSLLSVP